MREVSQARFACRGQFLVFEVQANAFLLHMVRNLVGSLLEIGKGRQSESWIAELMAGRDRTAAAMTAPPDGLYLVEVGYSEEWGLPLLGQQPVSFFA
jgi:tRNA pseudouridine38-40 synthase